MWEQRYDILQPKRTDTNIRFYDDDDLRLLLSISMLNDNGYKISKIAKMGRAEIHRFCGSLHDVNDEFSHQINALTLAMVELDEERFEKVFASNTLKYGFEDAMTKLIYPFFERVGVLWQTGTVLPLHEHFVSNLVRQKLVVAIDAQSPIKGPGVPKYVLFLPEGEMHELSLLFACYLLRSRKNQVFYLGPNVPEEDLKSIQQTCHPDYFLSILTANLGKDVTEAYIDRLAHNFTSTKILLSGIAMDGMKQMPANVTILKKASDLLPFAERR